MSNVSVVIYAHNNEDELRNFSSTFAQKVGEDTEIVLVDDCSDDATPAIVGKLSLLPEYAKTLRVISHAETTGKIAGWWSGIKAARAPYVVCATATDLIDFDAIRTLVEAVQQQDADIAVPTLRRAKNPYAVPLDVSQISVPQELTLTETKKILEALFVARDIEPQISGWLFKRDLIRQAFAEFSEERLAQSNEQGVCFIAAALAQKLITEPNVKLMVSKETNTSLTRTSRDFEVMCATHDTLTYIREYLIGRGLLEQYQQIYDGFSLMLCQNACKLYPSRVQASFWERGARMLLKSWGASRVAESYAHLPRTSLSEVSIALSSGIPTNNKKVASVALLINNPDVVAQAQKFALLCTKKHVLVHYIVDEGYNLPQTMNVVATLPTGVFSQERGSALKVGLENAEADALIMFSGHRQSAYDALVARSLNVGMGLICKGTSFSTAHLLEILPQVAFSSAVAVNNDIEAELFELLKIRTCNEQGLLDCLSDSSSTKVKMSARKLVYKITRMCALYLQTATLLKQRTHEAQEYVGKTHEEIVALKDEVVRLKNELKRTSYERDEYQAFFEGRRSRRFVRAHVGLAPDDKDDMSEDLTTR